jgi:hypothetical protein
MNLALAYHRDWREFCVIKRGQIGHLTGYHLADSWGSNEKIFLVQKVVKKMHFLRHLGGSKSLFFSREWRWTLFSQRVFSEHFFIEVLNLSRYKFVSFIQNHSCHIYRHEHSLFQYSIRSNKQKKLVFFFDLHELSSIHFLILPLFLLDFRGLI